MKRFFVKNIYRLLLNRIYNPFIETNLKPLELNLTPEDKCLVIAPHPDDESIGCGGIMKLHPKNFDVTCLTHGNINDIRFEEMQHAMEFAGVNSYKMLNLKDKNIIAGQSEFNTIDISQYDYIFIPYIFDQHRDHKNKAVLRRLLALLPQVNPRLRCLIRHSKDSATEWLPHLDYTLTVTIDTTMAPAQPGASLSRTTMTGKSPERLLVKFLYYR